MVSLRRIKIVPGRTVNVSADAVSYSVNPPRLAVIRLGGRSPFSRSPDFPLPVSLYRQCLSSSFKLRSSPLGAESFLLNAVSWLYTSTVRKDTAYRTGLALPESVGGLELNSLTSAAGLTLPDSIGYALELNGLTSAQGLTLPHDFEGAISLNGLLTAEGLILPSKLERVSLDGLLTAEGLILPSQVETADLNGLTTGVHLSLPEGFSGYLLLARLPLTEKESVLPRIKRTRVGRVNG